jgi:hypothetical protein
VLGWKATNREIRRCKSISEVDERINCLEKLFTRTNDGMVAFALTEELESCGKLLEALQYFEKAERLFPLTYYKYMAGRAIARVKNKLFVGQSDIKSRSVSNGLKCPKCGAIIPQDAEYCGFCGLKL